MEKINNLLLKNNESHQSGHQVQFLSTSQMQILLGQHKLSHRNSCMGGPTLIHQLRPSLEVEFRLCLSRVSNRKLNFYRSHRLLNFQKTERNLIRIRICKIVLFFFQRIRSIYHRFVQTSCYHRFHRACWVALIVQAVLQLCSLKLVDGPWGTKPCAENSQAFLCWRKLSFVARPVINCLIQYKICCKNEYSQLRKFNNPIIQ